MAQKNNVNEEVLELVWTKKEEGAVKRMDLLQCEDPKISQSLLEEMIKDSYLFEVKDEINLTEKGSRIAGRIIRSHRLAERLFVDVLEIGEKFLESNACTFEHILSPEIIRSICTLLGHPKECPHGRPIPQGDCCRKGIKEIERLVLPLDELKSGETGRIIYVATKHHSRLDRLNTLGISPGEEVHVHQTLPSFVIKAAETDIALDTEILKDIYVRKI